MRCFGALLLKSTSSPAGEPSLYSPHMATRNRRSMDRDPFRPQRLAQTIEDLGAGVCPSCRNDLDETDDGGLACHTCERVYHTSGVLQ